MAVSGVGRSVGNCTIASTYENTQIDGKLRDVQEVGLGALSEQQQEKEAPQLSLKAVSSDPRYYNKLHNEIYQLGSNEYKKYIDNELETLPKSENTTNLTSLYMQMAEVFSSQLNHMPEKSEKPCTLVLGPTGTGKSLLIGYLKGNPIEKKEVEIGISKKIRSVLEYKSDTKGNRPEIGHGSEQTRGAPVYDNYIDTGGFPFSSVKNIERRIWNAFALQLTIARYQPNRAIFMLSDINTSPKGRFVEEIRTLCEIFDQSSEATFWGNTLFVINNKEKNPELQEIKKKIELCSAELEEASEISPSNYQKAFEALEQIKEHSKFIIANFTTSQTRDEVNKWLSETQSHKHELVENCNFLSLIPGGERKLKTALNAARLYFEELEHRKVHYEKRIALGKDHAESEIQLKMTELKQKLKEQRELGKVLSDEILKQQNLASSSDQLEEPFMIEGKRYQLIRIEEDIQLLEELEDIYEKLNGHANFRNLLNKVIALANSLHDTPV